MATQASNTSQRDDAMTAGGPGADWQTPPSQGAPASSNGGDSSQTADQSAPDSENTPAQANQASASDSGQPGDTNASSSSSDGRSASPSTNGSAPASTANNGDNSGGSGDGASSASAANGDGSASAPNSEGSSSAADGSNSAGTGSGGGSGGNADGGNSATAENGDGSAGSGTGEDSALHLVGAGAPLQPIFDAVNGAASDVTGSSGLLHGLADVADTAGIGSIGATPSTDGHSNLITDLVNFPGDAVEGNLNGGLSHIFTDLSDTANAATGMVDDVLGGNTAGLVSSAADDASGLLRPATGLAASAGNDLQSGPLVSFNGDGLLTGSAGLPGTSPGDAVQLDTSLVGTNSPNSLLTVNGGNNAGDGGVTGAEIGDLNGSSSGNLVNLDAGPQSAHAASVGVLTAQPDGGNTANAGAVDVGPNGPQVADAGVLTDTHALNIASLNGAGTDSLTGNVIDVSTAETGASALQQTSVAVNPGEVHDVPAVPATQDHGIVDVNHTHII